MLTRTGEARRLAAFAHNLAGNPQVYIRQIEPLSWWWMLSIAEPNGKRCAIDGGITDTQPLALTDALLALGEHVRREIIHS